DPVSGQRDIRLPLAAVDGALACEGAARELHDAGNRWRTHESWASLLALLVLRNASVAVLNSANVACPCFIPHGR
ncbi:MAG: hypothetical protein WBW81_00850, partial [Methylocella sp.]